jgi:hypothetical protein
MLYGLWKQFLETDFCKIVIESEPNGGETLKLVSVKPIPSQIPLMLGDAIHSLRASLDYTINEILGHKNTRITFPMHQSKEQLAESFRIAPETIGQKKKNGPNAPVELAVNGLGDFIVNEIRPYKDSGNLLWNLNKLDVRDKHRLLIPVLNVNKISGINAIDRNRNRLVDSIATNSGNGVFNLAHFGAGGLKIESYDKPTAELYFNEPDIVESRPIILIFNQMANDASQAIKKIDEFLTSVSWFPPAS